MSTHTDEQRARPGIRPFLSTAEAQAELDDLRGLVGPYLQKYGRMQGDYDQIGGNYTLLKKGADKICRRFGLYYEPEIIHQDVDWAAEPVARVAVQVLVRLFQLSTGQIIGAGMGAAHNQEKVFQLGDRDNKYDGPAPDLYNKVLQRAIKRAYVNAVKTVFCMDSILNPGPATTTTQGTQGAAQTTRPQQAHAAAPDPEQPQQSARPEPPRRTTPTPVPPPAAAGPLVGDETAWQQMSGDASPLTDQFVALLHAGGDTLAGWNAKRAAEQKPPWDALTPSQQETVLDVFTRRAAQKAGAA